MTITSKSKTPTPSPHVKWGSLAFSIAWFLLAILLTVLELSLMLSGTSIIEVLLSFGPLTTVCCAFIGAIILKIDFIPSYSRYKNRKNIVSNLIATRAKALKLAKPYIKRESELYIRFLEEHPKYRV